MLQASLPSLTGRRSYRRVAIYAAPWLRTTLPSQPKMFKVVPTWGNYIIMMYPRSTLGIAFPAQGVYGRIHGIFIIIK